MNISEKLKNENEEEDRLYAIRYERCNSATEKLCEVLKTKIPDYKPTLEYTLSYANQFMKVKDGEADIKLTIPKLINASVSYGTYFKRRDDSKNYMLRLWKYKSGSGSKIRNSNCEDEENDDNCTHTFKEINFADEPTSAGLNEVLKTIKSFFNIPELKIDDGFQEVLF